MEKFPNLFFLSHSAMANFHVPPYAPPAAMFNTVSGYAGTVAGGGGKHASYVFKICQHEKTCSGSHGLFKSCQKDHIYVLNATTKS